MLFTDTRNPVVELGLTIASFTYGACWGRSARPVFRKDKRERCVRRVSDRLRCHDLRRPCVAHRLHVAHGDRVCCDHCCRLPLSGDSFVAEVTASAVGPV